MKLKFRKTKSKVGLSTFHHFFTISLNFHSASIQFTPLPLKYE